MFYLTAVNSITHRVYKPCGDAHAASPALHPGTDEAADAHTTLLVSGFSMSKPAPPETTPRWSHLSTLAILLGTSGQPGWGVVNPYLHKKTGGDKTLLTSSLGCTDADLLLRVHRDNCEGFQHHKEQHEPPPRIHGASVKPWYAQHVLPSLHLHPLAAKARAGQR